MDERTMMTDIPINTDGGVALADAAPSGSATVAPDRNDDLPSNWGRWGDRDELGTLNHISDAARSRGARAARTGRTVSLAHPVTPVPLSGGGPASMRVVPMPTPVQQSVSFNGIAYADLFIMNSHSLTMTHIDAVVHCVVDEKVYPGVSRHEAVSGGMVHHASTSVLADGITTRGVLLDLAPGGKLPEGYDVTAADLEEAERRQGLRVESGDALVVSGGWKLHEELGKPFPGMTVDAIRWMNEREVCLFAGDIGDRPPGYGAESDIIPLHFVALARLGMPLIDNARVDELAAVCAELGRWDFLFSLGTIPILGATGLPVNPLAVF